jgi:cytochrome b6-f complex iron-sulfur subunit
MATATQDQTRDKLRTLGIQSGPVPQMQTVSRRGFFSWIGLAWTSFALASGGFLAALGRFFFPNVLFEPPSSFKAGVPDDYAVGVVDERWKDQYRVWIVRTEREIYALSAICTHLGCPPNWLPLEKKFKCPCHGSGFYMSGINFEGPAPRPLERVKISLAADGQLLIDKNQIFQQEKGDWSNPDSFVVV